MLARRGRDIKAEFSNLPAAPTFADVSAIGHLVIEEYLEGKSDQVFLIYTDYINLLKQIPRMKTLLPLELEVSEDDAEPWQKVRKGPEPAYIYEPSSDYLLEQIVPRLTGLQIYQAIQESLASEHAARMVAMRNATDNANELVTALKLAYNKARQKAITLEILDIVGGAEALTET